MNPDATTAVQVPEEAIVQQPSQFGDLNLSNKREPNELYCDYKCRQWWINRILKHYLRGVPVWHGHQGQKIGSFS